MKISGWLNIIGWILLILGWIVIFWHIDFLAVGLFWLAFIIFIVNIIIVITNNNY